MIKINEGKPPVEIVRGQTLAETTYKAWIKCYTKGVRVKSVKHVEGDPLAWDFDLTVVVNQPLKEPKVFTPAMPGDEIHLETYRLEVVYGIHDHWVGHGWDYTYHQRIAPQIPLVLDKIENTWLEKGRITSRDFQMTTWRWETDLLIDDPPCLQIIHLRLLPTSIENYYLLNFKVAFRSRDLGAGFWENAYAFIPWQQYFIREIGERLSKYGIKIGTGRYIDNSFSSHIYGRFEILSHFTRTIENMRKKPWRSFAKDTSFIYPDDRLIEIRHFIAAQLEYERVTQGNEMLSSKAAPKGMMDELGIDWKNFPYPKEWDD